MHFIGLKTGRWWYTHLGRKTKEGDSGSIPAVDIVELLSRRSDLSGFVVHLTRTTDADHPARKNLKNILRQQVIEARTPFGLAVSELRTRDDEDLRSQYCVSFSETPLEHLFCLIQRIPKRRVQLSSYGLAFTKMTARERGVNPVWYVDITPGHDWLTTPLNKLVAAEIKRRKKFRESPLALVTPFIEPMGSGLSRSGYGYRKEFWWEREWRHRGDFRFFKGDVAFGLAPENKIEELEDFSRELQIRIRFIDPEWSLERMVAHMSGSKGAMTPFG